MTTRDPHMGCIADARDEIEAARRAFLDAHHAVVGGEITGPNAGTHSRWTLTLSILTGPEHDADGFEPAHQDTARAYGLTAWDVEPKGPNEHRAVLLL